MKGDDNFTKKKVNVVKKKGTNFSQVNKILAKSSIEHKNITPPVSLIIQIESSKYKTF